MSKPDNGGPAFPGPVGYHPGMSLRDYFAGQALAAMLTHDEAFDDLGETTVAQMAYDQADAMLAVRQMPAESVAEAGIGDATGHGSR